jgi:hypothetical protein
MPADVTKAVQRRRSHEMAAKRRELQQGFGRIEQLLAMLREKADQRPSAEVIEFPKLH